LQRGRRALSCEAPEIFHPATGITKPETNMLAEGRERFRILGLSPKPAWAEVWHLWNVILPRRSITGRLLTGQVWRRHDGRRWIYKKFSEYGG
jgi:hypothetical protein